MPIALTNPHCSLAAAAAATSMHRYATEMIGIWFYIAALMQSPCAETGKSQATISFLYSSVFMDKYMYTVS
jgi:hypothetical protein